MNIISTIAVKERIAWLGRKFELLVPTGRYWVRNKDIVTIGLLITIVSFINTVWLSQDTRPQPDWDPNGYLRETLEFVDESKVQGSTNLWQSVTAPSLRGRPPLYQLLSVPFVYSFGRSADAALSVNILFEAMLLLSTYGIGKLAGNGKAGLLAALLVATYPPIVGLSKIYAPWFATTACVALSLWLLLLLLKKRTVKIAWLFGMSLGFGMLIRHFFVFHLPVPAVVFGLYMLLFQTNPRRPPNLSETPRWLLYKLRDPFVLYGLLPAGLIAALLTASWYLTEVGASFIELVPQVQGVNFTMTRGFKDIASYSFWWYALTAPGAISYVFTALFIIGLVFGIFKRQLYTSALVITFLASYIALSLQKGLDWLRFAPVLPIVAALTAVWIVGMRNRRFSIALTLVCIVIAIFNFSIVTWGVRPWSRPVAIALGAPLDSDTCSQRINMAFCPNPARDEDWRGDDILQVILNDPECQKRRCYVTVVSEHENLSPGILTYHLVRDFAEALTKVNVALLTPWYRATYDLKWLSSDYLVYIPQWSGGIYSDAVTAFLNSPSDVFDDVHQEAASFSLPRGQTIKLIKRTRPLTLDEAEEVVAALDLPETDVAFLRQQLAPLKVKELLDEGAEVEAFNLAMQALGSDALTDEDKAVLAASTGNQLVSIGETAQAIELLNQIAPDTHNAHVWVILGKAHHSEGSLDKAASAYERALVLDPQHYWANHLLAGIYAKRTEWEDVVQLEQMALKVATIDSDRVNSGIRLVEAYENLGNWESACAVLEQVEQWAEENDTRVKNLDERLACRK